MEYGHINGSGTLFHPLFVMPIFMWFVNKSTTYFIHCLWCQFSCGLWTKATLIPSNFNPLIKCIEQFPWTQRIDCTPWCVSSLQDPF
jgi:hypothetical protein